MSNISFAEMLVIHNISQDYPSKLVSFIPPFFPIIIIIIIIIRFLCRYLALSAFAVIIDDFRIPSGRISLHFWNWVDRKLELGFQTGTNLSTSLCTAYKFPLCASADALISAGHTHSPFTNNALLRVRIIFVCAHHDNSSTPRWVVLI